MKKPFQLSLILASILLLLLVSLFFHKINEEHNIKPEKLTVTYPTDTSLVNLNTADAIQLQTLPGIGEKLAQNIIAYRDAVGTIRDYTELLNIDGIGQNRLDAILPYVTLGG